MLKYEKKNLINNPVVLDREMISLCLYYSDSRCECWIEPHTY